MAMGLPGLRCCDLAARGPLPLPPLGPALPRRPPPRASPLRYSSLQAPAGDSIGDEVLRMFLEERQLHGDFVTKISDMVWRRNGANVDVLEATSGLENAANVAQPDVREEVTGEGVLRLAATRDWVSGESDLPVRKRLSAKDRQNDSDKRKELNLLKYEALKDELLLLTTGIGAACSLYCLLVFSLEAAISYAFGVAFSCLYLQLLYRHTDNLSKEDIPEIFLKKKNWHHKRRFEEYNREDPGWHFSSPIIPKACDSCYDFWIVSYIRSLPEQHFQFSACSRHDGFPCIQGCSFSTSLQR
ncbi:uncharacterized protein LOC133916201 isoform X3 [Phragmites australis]|uniref:uncharacterized protein LOC133916201 isoform X3 n=1 Tax=Phragmites australis TaxID=29695 RepID=UPI002D7863E4|nr:uncharacterized protein LOC133916201 isoform X3 [Phragmites australis]